MNPVYEKLEEMGVGKSEHLNGSLIDHLKGTQKILERWQADSDLQKAGLYHAVYGTSAFPMFLVGLENREKVAKIIGESAERITYQYCACDRKYFYQELASSETPKYKDRFTDEVYQLSSQELEEFSELTAANELEIAIYNPRFILEYGSELRELFKSLSSYLSCKARSEVQSVF